jgi:hypothetical protein
MPIMLAVSKDSKMLGNCWLLCTPSLKRNSILQILKNLWMSLLLKILRVLLNSRNLEYSKNEDVRVKKDKFSK